MKTCGICSKEINDFDEIKYGKCWECLSANEEIAESDPDLGKIRDEDESYHQETYSIVVRDSNGTTLRMGAPKKAGKAKLTDPAVDDATKKNEKPATTKKDEKPPVAQEDDSEPPQKTTTETGKTKEKPPAVEPTDEGMKVVRESKEVITNSGRAKLRALAIINQAVKETGDFDVVVMVEGQRLTVSSKPIDVKNIEQVLMTTTMEALDAPNTSGQKPKK